MPAHIATGKYFSAAGRFAAQALPSKYQPRTTYVTANAARHHGSAWITPMFAASIPDQHKKSREILCRTYDEYRKALDGFITKSAKTRVLDQFPWYKGSIADPRNHESTADRAEVRKNDDNKWDIAGFNHFKKEWDLYLKMGTPFDHAVYARLATGETITLIRRSSEVRSKQLKRIEANTAHGTEILWSIH